MLVIGLHPLIQSSCLLPPASVRSFILMSKAKLFWGIVIGAIAGIIVGGFVGHKVEFFDFLGTFFLNALKGLVIPLIIFSLIAGMASLGDIRKIGQVGSKTLIYYFATTMMAIFIGIVMVNLFQPGASPMQQVLAPVVNHDPITIKGLFLHFISPNIVESMANMDILPLVIFALVFGAALTSLGEKGKKATEFFNIINEAILKIVHWVIYLAPIGIFGLVASIFGDKGGFDGVWLELARIGKYVLVVAAALAIHGLFVLVPILMFVAKRNPITFVRQVSPALLTAFSTDSSSATLPVTLESVEERANISKKTSRFVAPLGATVNMDGTALYEAVAAIFIAQVYNIDLSVGQQIIIFLTAMLAAIGAAGIPHAGLVTLVLVLQSVGLPTEGIGYLLAIDWLLDRFRTTINVWGDCIGCAVIEKLSAEKKKRKK